ncbi:acyl-CoA dehydrogenase family protein [Sphingorhabdus sp.]|uniref:acyl-CoA dehydrogenase family protein n=1 Tax=Sphingorhabdus sp. TaxID=1902408 RepID=UPI0037C53873
MWNFSNDPEFQPELDWIREFVRIEVAPLDYVLGSQWNIHDPDFKRLVRPLQQKVKDRGLWACHLGPALGGKGYGQLKLALMSEQFGYSRFGPVVFGAQAPDSGNSEILAHFGSEELKARYLGPLLQNEIVSCFSVTEPHGGADPLQIRTTAVQDGKDWVINGEKWFASSASYAEFYIIMALTDPDAPSHQKMSLFVVSADTPGIEVIRNYSYHGEIGATHGHVRWTGVRVPAQNMLGARGQGFAVAQLRLGGGRLHHAMRGLAEATRCFEMMCERVNSRALNSQLLSSSQMTQEKIADSWVELRQFRLLILETAWLADQGHSWKDLRRNVSAVKMTMPRILHDIASRALHLHGSLGLSTEMPFAADVINSFHLGLADGPTEVHKLLVARETLKQYPACADIFPDYMHYRQVERAQRRMGMTSPC